MEYIVGVVLALATIAMARVVGMDRDRALYPMLLMVVATYYVANPGVPEAWPGFCMAYDVAAGLALAILIRTGARPTRA